MGTLYILPTKSNAHHFKSHFESAISPLMQKDILEIICMPEEEKTGLIIRAVENLTESLSRSHPCLEVMQANAREILFEGLDVAEEDFGNNTGHDVIRRQWLHVLDRAKTKLTTLATTRPPRKPGLRDGLAF